MALPSGHTVNLDSLRRATFITSGRARASTDCRQLSCSTLRKTLISRAAQQLHPAALKMGAFQSVPDDVLTGTLTACVVGNPYHKPKYKEKMLVLRTTCKDGRNLVPRILADKKRFPSMCLFFRPSPSPEATEPREMRVSARHVEAVGRVFGAGCTALFADGRSPERIAALESFVSRATRLDHLELLTPKYRQKCF